MCPLRRSAPVAWLCIAQSICVTQKIGGFDFKGPDRSYKPRSKRCKPQMDGPDMPVMSPRRPITEFYVALRSTNSRKARISSLVLIFIEFWTKRSLLIIIVIIVELLFTVSVHAHTNCRLSYVCLNTQLILILQSMCTNLYYIILILYYFIGNYGE